MSAIDTVLAAAEARGAVKRVGAEFVTNCPAHPDENPSCHFHEMDNGNVVVKCRSRACAFKDIAAGWGLTQQAFFPPKTGKPKQKGLGPCVATFLYELTHGNTAYKACRFQFPGSREKTFVLFRPDGNGKWIANLKGVERIPYRWPELLEADPSAPACILEGERKVDLVREKFGMVGTCNFGGTGGSAQWKTPAFQKAVKDRDIIISPDHDEPGEKHAATVAQAIVSVARSVKIVRLPLKNAGDDVVQFIEAGGTREQFLALVAAAPLWTPAQAEPAAADAVIPPGSEYHNTDDGHARRLAVHVAGRWHFVVEWLKFIHDTGKRWEIDKAGTEILAETSAITKQLLAEAAATDDKVARLMRIQEAKTTEGLRCKTNAIALLKAQSDIAISASKLDTHHTLLNCDGVIVDLETGQTRPYSPDLLLTKCLPWPYVKGAPRRRWLQFLAEVMPDEETVDYAQRLLGYYLTGSTVEQVLVFLHGLGANGKTIFIRVLLALLGEYAIQSPMTMLLETQNERHSTELADLRGVRLTACTETPAGQSWNEPLVKQLTGSDKIRARKLYQDHEEFEPTHKIIVVGNYRPRVKGSDLGIWRRLKLIPFERTFTEGKRDPHLLEKLLDEMPGILAWAVEGALLWQRDGLGCSRKIAEATSAYRDESDILGPFLLECCVVNPEARAVRPAMYGAFVRWMDEQGYKHAPSPQAFAEMMRCRGFDDTGTMRVAGKSKPVWRGVGLLDSQTAMTAMTAMGNSGNFLATQPHEEEVPGNGHSTHSSHSTLTADPGDPDNEVIS